MANVLIKQWNGEYVCPTGSLIKWFIKQDFSVNDFRLSMADTIRDLISSGV